ncbi:hypothetical protein GLOIN_2v1768552 [Rhizophagus irregularis DAOM 181602=DAOM 197198]|nr:hypothetical protein GLOIN_2v1768552 [Rhizophagus irregularis DAOM 181602=DAOM 197198]
MDLEKSLEYENLEESLTDKNETFYSEYDENESFNNVEENESLESLFELDFNMLTNAKKLVQQNISEEEDNWEDLSDIGSNFSETESDDERDEIITKVPNNENLTPCVVIDMLDGKIQRRGPNCENHSYKVIGKNIQVPCIGQMKCGALQTYHSFVIPTNSSKHARYICMNCYEEKGGHIYQRVGQGIKKDPNCDNLSHHKNDTKKALEVIGYWILNIANSDNLAFQEKILAHLAPILCIINTQEKSETTSSTLLSVQNIKNEVPSLFIILIILILVKFNYNFDKKLNPKNLTSKHFFEFGEALAHSIILAKNELKIHKKLLESPTSIEEYHRQRKYRKKPLKPLNYEKITKQTTFFISIILNIAFKGWKIWLPRTMASLCRKPKLLSSLQGILEVVNITSHSQRHERNLEKIRALLVDPTDRICHEKNIWNLGIIDNVDFKETTFGYGNIFDAVRGNSHATLRMLFQYQLPNELPEIIEIQDENKQKLFGQNNFSQQTFNIFNSVFEQLLTFNENLTPNYRSDFNEDDIRNQIMTHFEVSFNLPPPNVIILDAGDPPSSDSAVHKCLEMYKNEIGMENNEYINVVADEAIFRRGISYCKTNQKTKMILGQWHTNKDMMMALITIFSGYGIFNMAGILGVRFLDKLEKGVDFRATSRVLELIWISVGIAIHIYVKKKKQTLDNILKEENNCVKVWYLYFQWASYWRAHWFGIRWGIFDLQHESLKAFSPLFPIAGKSNYARSVTYHIHCIENNPLLRKMLRTAPSINLTSPGHFFAYDEALETFGVKFVKQNVTRIPADGEELKLRIKATQLEKERTEMLICDYIGDSVQSSRPRNVQSRKEKIWELAHLLINAFESLNPLENPVFEFCNNLNDDGVNQLIIAYDIGIKRLQTIANQEIFLTESYTTIGRRARNITR